MTTPGAPPRCRSRPWRSCSWPATAQPKVLFYALAVFHWMAALAFSVSSAWSPAHAGWPMARYWPRCTGSFRCWLPRLASQLHTARLRRAAPGWPVRSGLAGGTGWPAGHGPDRLCLFLSKPTWPPFDRGDHLSVELAGRRPLIDSPCPRLPLSTTARSPLPVSRALRSWPSPPCWRCSRSAGSTRCGPPAGPAQHPDRDRAGRTAMGRPPGGWLGNGAFIAICGFIALRGCALAVLERALRRMGADADRLVAECGVWLAA